MSISEPHALQGLKVLDFSHALAGPYCTLLLSDYGARVYKLESPDGGDMGRTWGPPFAGEYAQFFLGLNRGKQGIAIDLKRPEGLDLCWRLIGEMDVLIENFRPGTMDRLGLGYQAVHSRHPKLVYCSISGYGQTGPSRDGAAMDLVVECSSGFLSITGTESGDVARAGYAVCDINAGLFATIGILMALRAREHTGQGQYVDIAMQDGMISTMSSPYMTYLGSGVVPGPFGTKFPTVTPYQVFHAKDGDFSIAVGSEKLWAAFCRAIERDDLREYPHFATNPDRVAHREELEGVLSKVFASQPVSVWVERFSAAGIPCSPVLNLQQVAEHPHSAARGMFPVVQHPTEGALRVTGPPIKFSETPGTVGAAAPRLGEHTAQVLAEVLKMESADVKNLAARGVIVGPA